MRLRAALFALCVLLTALGVGAVLGRGETSIRAGDPPDGWYLVADLPPDEPIRAPTEVEEWAKAEAMADTARRAGYRDAVVWPQGKQTEGCWQMNVDASKESKCVRSTSVRGYVVALKGPLGQPPDGSPGVRAEWLQRTWREEQALAAKRGLPYGVVPGIYLFSDSGRRRAADDSSVRPPSVDRAGPVIESIDLPDGWYLAVSPGAFTVDDKVALYAARAMAGQMRSAGYEDIRIVRWENGARCKPWTCTSDGPIVAYVVVLDGPYATPDEAAQKQALAREHGTVATPFVVRLQFSAADS